MADDCGLFAKMRHRVELQAVARVSDGQGGYTESWATYATVWAYLRPAKGYEKFLAGQTQTPVTHKATVRYRSDLTTAHRLLYGTRVMAVKEVLNPEEADRFLVLLAVEQT